MLTPDHISDSSDEEVVWGPLTKKEIKKALKSSNNIRRQRETIYSFTTPRNIERKMDKPADSTISTYLDYHTADESLNSEEMKEQIEKCIAIASTSDECLSVSDYKTDCQPSNTDEIISLSSDDEDENFRMNVKVEETSGNSRVFQSSRCLNDRSGLVDLEPNDNEEIVWDNDIDCKEEEVEYIGEEKTSQNKLIEQIESLGLGSDSHSADKVPLKSFENHDNISCDSLLSDSFESYSNVSVERPENGAYIEEDLDDTLDDINKFLEENDSVQSEFKIPDKPVRLPFGKSPMRERGILKPSPNKFRDIVSPVRLYIKNSPAPVLKRNHKPALVRSNCTMFGVKENIPARKHRNLVNSFPEIIYKPSKRFSEDFDRNMIIPNNIKKLLKEGVVIKHEGRRRVDLDESEISTTEKLCRGDLSYIVSDEKNISLHVNKAHYNK